MLHHLWCVLYNNNNNNNRTCDVFWEKTRGAAIILILFALAGLNCCYYAQQFAIIAFHQHKSLYAKSPDPLSFSLEIKGCGLRD